MQSRRRNSAFLCFLCCVLFSSCVFAHSIGVSTGSYEILGNIVVANLTFAQSELIQSFRNIDLDSNGALTELEVSGAGANWQLLLRRTHVTEEGNECLLQSYETEVAEQDGLNLRALYRCGRRSQRVSVRFSFFDNLTSGHRHIATANSTVVVTFAGNPEIRIAAPGAEGASSVPAFFIMGLEHILTGYDHLVFLLGLVVVSARLRPALLTVSAFTIGHSFSLAITVLGIWAPTPSFVEPVIALSIVYIGVENLFVKSMDSRWRITLPFGLIHGFGFGGALREISVAREDILQALASFNLGVEAGQLAILALLLPLMLWMRSTVWFDRAGATALSAGIALAGCFWFVLRLM